MKTLGNTDLNVSRWCLGANPFGWTADEEQSYAVLDAYVAAGGNFIDTADNYPPGSAGGISEEILGRWIRARGNRDELVVATKVGSPLPGQDAPDLSRESVLRRTEESLRRLQLDHVDLLYAHHDDKRVPLEETLGALDELVRAGKARHLAVSNYKADRLEEALGVARREGFPPYAVFQCHYNLLERTEIPPERQWMTEPYEGRLADLCVREGLAVVPYWVLAKGFLTGKYRPGSNGAGLSDRAAKHRPHEYSVDERAQRVLTALHEIAAAHGSNPAAVAMAWTDSRPAVATPLVSARTPDQLADLDAMTSLELSDDERDRLTRASDR